MSKTYYITLPEDLDISIHLILPDGTAMLDTKEFKVVKVYREDNSFKVVKYD